MDRVTFSKNWIPEELKVDLLAYLRWLDAIETEVNGEVVWG